MYKRRKHYNLLQQRLHGTFSLCNHARRQLVNDFVVYSVHDGFSIRCCIDYSNVCTVLSCYI